MSNSFPLKLNNTVPSNDTEIMNMRIRIGLFHQFSFNSHKMRGILDTGIQTAFECGI